MASDEPTIGEAKAMGDVQVAVEGFVRERFSRVEAALIAAGLTRIIRTLLDNYRPELQAELLKATVAYLERRELTEESALNRLGFVGPSGLVN